MSKLELWGLVVAIFVAVYVLDEPLRKLLAVLASGAHGIFSDLLDALDRTRDRCRQFRQEHLGSGAGLRPLLGAAPITALAATLVWADFTVTLATLRSLLPQESAEWKTIIGGYPIGLAESSAFALVGFHFLAGFALLESLGLTRFFPLERLVSSKAIRGMRVGCLLVLMILGIIGAGLAMWRTNQIQRSATMYVDYPTSVLPTADDLARQTIVSSAMPGFTGNHRPWIDTLPDVLMPALAFLIPVASAFAGIGIYFGTLSLFGALLSLVVILPLDATRFALRLARHILDRLLQLLNALLDLLIAPGSWAAGAVGALARRLRGLTS